ncbi:hypothetical protein C0995_000726 [Termitomyces sp. Mi166|nr:hypothetical protein C0995_000726 [Termitomyces sp. Mi166\
MYPCSSAGALFTNETCTRKPSSIETLAYGSGPLKTEYFSFSARFGHRYNLRALHAYDEDDFGFPGWDGDVGYDSGEDETPSFAAASGSGSQLTSRPGEDDATERDFDAFPPRITLLNLPVEIIEHIAACLRHPVSVLEAASRYIDDRYSDFADTRFSLSAYSKTCSKLRPIVERVLYRDIQLDFTGWKGRKHTQWPAASLYLLLRTLRKRPELGRHVHAAALDYQLSTESKALEDGLEEFLGSTPNLKTLYLWQCPLALWNFAPLKITTFATTYAPGIIPSTLNHFPKLENLYLRDCSVMSFSPDLPRHNLKSVRLDSNHHHAVSHFSRALTLCSKTVEHLDIRFIGGLLHQSPEFAPKIDHVPPAPATNLRSLRLDNISVFSNLDSAYTQLLQSLTTLEHLHVSHHSCFSPRAFTVLPPYLRRLTVSDYYSYWENRPTKPHERNRSFMLGFASCFMYLPVPLKISEVVASPGSDADNESLKLVVETAMLEKIKYYQVEESTAFIEVFFIRGQDRVNFLQPGCD